MTKGPFVPQEGDTVNPLADGLSAVAGRLTPAEAAGVGGPAARALADAMEHEKDAYTRGSSPRRPSRRRPVHGPD